METGLREAYVSEYSNVPKLPIFLKKQQFSTLF